MGVIEDTIFENYRRSISKGNIKQAKLAVDLASDLVKKVEGGGFLDYKCRTQRKNASMDRKNVFKPFPYSYYPREGVVVINNSAINLSYSENKLFYLLSNNESSGTSINIISKEHIIDFMWRGRVVTKAALRTAIQRVRRKIETDAGKPQIIISFYSKGYIFLGNRIIRKE